jgi:hypothetical protein
MAHGRAEEELEELGAHREHVCVVCYVLGMYGEREMGSRFRLPVPLSSPFRV